MSKLKFTGSAPQNLTDRLINLTAHFWLQDDLSGDFVHLDEHGQWTLERTDKILVIDEACRAHHFARKNSIPGVVHLKPVIHHPLAQTF